MSQSLGLSVFGTALLRKGEVDLGWGGECLKLDADWPCTRRYINEDIYKFYYKFG